VTNVGKICGICGATIIAVVINGMPVERCNHDSASACPGPGIEWSDAHTPDPEAAPVATQTSEIRPIIAMPPGQQLSLQPAPRRRLEIYDTSQGTNVTQLRCSGGAIR